MQTRELLAEIARTVRLLQAPLIMTLCLLQSLVFTQNAQFAGR